MCKQEITNFLLNSPNKKNEKDVFKNSPDIHRNRGPIPTTMSHCSTSLSRPQTNPSRGDQNTLKHYKYQTRDKTCEKHFPSYMCNRGVSCVTVKCGRRLKGHGFRSRRERLIPIQARLPTWCQLDGAIRTILLCGLWYLGGVTSHSAGSYGGPCAALLDNSHVAGQLRSTIS